MKYLKLYEDYYTDVDKLQNQIDDARDKLYEIKQEIYSELKKVYDINKDVKNELHIDIDDVLYLYEDYRGDYKNKISVIIKTSKKTTQSFFIIDMDAEELATVMDTVIKKFPEYFEGKSMGFFDLKTND